MTRTQILILGLVWIGLALANGSCEKEATIEVAQFTQSFPEADAIGVGVQPIFRWREATGAETYDLTIALDASFTRNVLIFEGIADTQYTLTTPLQEGFLYYWKVTAVNGSGQRISDNAGIAFRVQIDPVMSSPSTTAYYVAPDGEDNPDCGSFEKPFKTLAYAATRVPADEGDVIELAAGTFLENFPAVIPTGVHVKGAGQDKTILSSAGVAVVNSVDPNAPDFKLWYDGSLIQLVSPHRKTFRNPSSQAYAPAIGNQILSDFTIDGNNKSLKAGVWVENRDSVIMHHVTIRNCKERGAVFAPGVKNWFAYPEFYMKGIRIHDCTFLNSGKDLSDESLGNLNIAQLEGAEIYNLIIEDNQGYGIKFIYDGYFKDLYIHDCAITVNESDAKWGEDIAIELWNVGPGNYIENIVCNTWLSIVNHPEMFGTPGDILQMKIRNVTMKDTDGASTKEGIEIGAPGVEVMNCYIENKGFGVAIWDMGRSDITIRNNIFYNTTVKNNWASGAAVYIDNSRDWAFKNIHIYNNVFDTHAVAVKIKGSSIQDIDIRNNAFLNSVTADVEAMGTNIVATNNLKFTAENTPWVLTGTTSHANNILGNPGFIFSGSRSSNYYKPAASESLVVDKGVDVGFNYTGSAPDIGYAEFAP